jgi:hypothetical protein
MKVFWFFFSKKEQRFFLNPRPGAKEAKIFESSGSETDG